MTLGLAIPTEYDQSDQGHVGPFTDRLCHHEDLGTNQFAKLLTGVFALFPVIVAQVTALMQNLVD